MDGEHIEEMTQIGSRMKKIGRIESEVGAKSKVRKTKFNQSKSSDYLIR
ncbi:TPA: hypothetical protein ACS705_000177 [Providencia alcalifaciens]